MTNGGDYFELFGLPQSYEIDLAALDAAYEKLSLEHHPDFFATAGEANQAQAERTAAQLNEGYRVLRCGAERAAYLLNQLRKERELDNTRLPDGFLQEMFMLQEEVDELGGEAEEQEKAPLRAQTEARMEAVRGERAGLFAVAESDALPKVLQDIQTNLNCGKYLRRLLDRLQ